MKHPPSPRWEDRPRRSARCRITAPDPRPLSRCHRSDFASKTRPLRRKAWTAPKRRPANPRWPKPKEALPLGRTPRTPPRTRRNATATTPEHRLNSAETPHRQRKGAGRLVQHRRLAPHRRAEARQHEVHRDSRPPAPRRSEAPCVDRPTNGRSHGAEAPRQPPFATTEHPRRSAETLRQECLARCTTPKRRALRR